MFTKKDQQVLSERYTHIQEMGISPLAGQSPVGNPVVMAVPTPPMDGEENEEHDHSEIEMAAADLYKLSEYTPKLIEMINQMPSLEGWVAAKITKAADYISSVYHWVDYQQHSDEEGEGCGCDHDMHNTGYETITTPPVTKVSL